MPRNRSDVTPAELALLQRLWDAGPATIRALTDTLYPDGGASAYATVQKLLERLRAKGFVRRDDAAPAHVFTAAVPREELIARRLRDLADSLCGGSLTPLLTNLVSGRRLSSPERAALRQLVADLEDLPRRGKR
jgi:predicted transcriptional regulator